MAGLCRAEVAVMAFAVVAAASCSIDRSVFPCEEGRILECMCDGGRAGSVKCVNGRYDECDCPLGTGHAGSGHDGDGSVISDAYDPMEGIEDGAQPVDQSSSGGGQWEPTEPTPDTGQPHVDAGAHDTGQPHVDAGTHDTGRGRDAADRDSGDGAESMPDSSQDAGDRDAGDSAVGVPDGGQDASDKDAGDDASEPDAGPDAGPTQVYGKCVQGECSGEQECVTVIDGDGTYCSIECEETQQCPRRPGGTVTRRCSSADNMCRLNCAGDTECPSGMECFSAEGRYTCVWP